ncbi:hypothetical protein ABZ814_16605 [Micromonospora musae]|uniref:hypothetical protein n=1 Tax=Micromonospora musae TaxID=1894970 RepID=UPI0033E45BAB
MTDRPTVVPAVLENPIETAAESATVVGPSVSDDTTIIIKPAVSVRTPAAVPSDSGELTVVITPAAPPKVPTPVAAPSASDDTTIIIKPAASRRLRTAAAARSESDDTTVIITPAARRVDTPTMLMAVIPRLPPVFVDPTGRRRSRLRLVAYALGLLGLAYTGLVGASFAGASVSPGSILPFVESTKQPWQPPPIPATIPDPTPTGSKPAPGVSAGDASAPAGLADEPSSAGDRQPPASGRASVTEPHG